MSDLIERQAAINAMAQALWLYPNEYYRNLNVYAFAKGLAEIGLRNVPSAQPALQWIPVTERLPEKQERVLTVDKYGSICVSEWLPSVDDDLYGWMSDIHELENDIIAWMPLPEPYREDGE